MNVCSICKAPHNGAGPVCYGCNKKLTSGNIHTDSCYAQMKEKEVPMEPVLPITKADPPEKKVRICKACGKAIENPTGRNQMFHPDCKPVKKVAATKKLKAAVIVRNGCNLDTRYAKCEHRQTTIVCTQSGLCEHRRTK